MDTAPSDSPLEEFLCETDDNPYSEDGVRLAWGEQSDGQLVHISAVPRGLACACVCPACGANLVARKRSKRHHFAHYAVGECRFGPETALHKLAKQLLDRSRRLVVPEVSHAEGGELAMRHRGGEYEFDSVRLEHRLHPIVPDVILSKGGRELIVEIAVTNPCSEEKISKISALGIAAIEVDLSEYPRDASLEVVTAALLSEAPRKWLFNPLLDDCVRTVRETIARKKAIEAERAEKRTKRFLDAVQDATVKRAADRRTNRAAVIRTVVDAGYERAIGLPIAGDYCFAVSTRHWQAAILEAFVLERARREPGGFYRIEAGRVTDWAKRSRLLHPGLSVFISPEDEAAIQRKEPDFRSPFAVISAYLELLEEADILYWDYSGWELSRSLVRHWMERRRQQSTCDERQSTVLDVAHRIAANIPKSELGAFTVDQWYRRPVPKFGISFEQAIATDNARFFGMRTALDQLESMIFHHGAVTDLLLGFPLEKEKSRIVELRRIENERQKCAARETARILADGRIKEIEKYAEECVGSDAEAWLSIRRPEWQNRAAREHAHTGDDALLSTKQVVYAEYLRRKAIWDREEQAASFKADLQRATEKTVREGRISPELAHLFLNSPRRKTGGKHPLQFCADAATLAICMDELRQVTTRR